MTYAVDLMLDRLSVHAFGRAALLAVRALPPDPLRVRVQHGVFDTELTWPIDPGAEPWVGVPHRVLTVIDVDDETALRRAREWLSSLKDDRCEACCPSCVDESLAVRATTRPCRHLESSL